jgi:hypothetical protein
MGSGRADEMDFLDVAPGALVVAEAAEARAAALRRVAARFFCEDETATLIYIGDRAGAEALRDELPEHRVGHRIESLPRIAERRLAALIGYGDDEESQTYARLDLFSALSLARDRIERTPFVLALDNFLPLVPPGREAAFIKSLRASLAAGALAPIIAIRSVEEVKGVFGFPDVYTLFRFEENYILRSDMNVGYLALVPHPDEFPAQDELPDGSAEGLPPGRIVFVRQTEANNCVTLTSEVMALGAIHADDAEPHRLDLR